MANETNNNTAANETTDDGNVTTLIDTVEESGILDTIMDSPELMLCLVVMAAMAAYIAYTQPKFMALVMPYIKKYDDEIMSVLEKNMTKAKMTAFNKLDEATQKHVKDKILKDVIMSAWDQNDDAMAGAVKAKVQAALSESK